MFPSRDAHNGTIITSERGASRRRLDGKEDSKNAHRHDLRKRKTQKGAHCVTAATERRGRSRQRESVACTDSVYNSDEECYIQRTAVSCQRTRSVRLLGAAQRKALLRGCESHTGLIAPPRPQLLTGIGNFRKHVRGALHVLRTRRPTMCDQVDRSWLSAVIVVSSPT